MPEFKTVRGCGPCPTDLAIVGIKPGYKEGREGKPFVGRSGEELDFYLEINDLPRKSQIWLTNLFKEFKRDGEDYTKDDRERDFPILQEELERAQPSVIVTLGREPTQYFLGEVDLEGTNAIPWRMPNSVRKFTDNEVTIFPVYHPAGAMRRPEISPLVMNGFEELAAYWRGETEARTLFNDPYEGKTDYREVTSVEQLVSLTKHWGPHTSIAIDSEGYPWAPWSLQFTEKAGTGYLIRASRADLLDLFDKILKAAKPSITFHSALHDVSMGKPLGVSFDGLRWDDTMVMAYLLQIEPRGLKAGSLRHCGMKMMEYAEVIGDASNDRAREYLVWLFDGEQAKYEERCEEEFIRLTTTPYVDKKGKTRPGRRLKVWPKLPKSTLHKAAIRVLGSARPAELWNDQVADIIDAAAHQLGPLPEGSLDQVSPLVSIPYGCRDTDGTTRLKAEYERRIDAKGLRDIYELEMSTYPLLARMQQTGMKIDRAAFGRLGEKLAIELDTIREKLKHQLRLKDVDEDVVEAFNANSGDRVEAVLWSPDVYNVDEDRERETTFMTDSGRHSTNDKVLEALEKDEKLSQDARDFVATVRQYREVYKLKSTFVDALPLYLDRYPRDGRIHPTFRTTRVVTGRLAASDPNVLAMPKHGKFAKDFRKCFVAAEGHVLAEWDLSQIELRVGAHLSQDPYMLAIYRGEIRNPDGSKVDLHAGLAQRIFGVPKKDQTSGQRTSAKAINFGFWMGQTEYGLCAELNKNGVSVSVDDAKIWLDEANRTYQGAQAYKDAMVAQAEHNGYIRCPLSGRIRYIGGIRSNDEYVRAEAERFSYSTPIQETAQYLMKRAEARIYKDVLKAYWADGTWVEPLLQCHDALTFEATEDKELLADLNWKISTILTDAPEGFSVPIETSGDWGYNWAEMHGFDELLPVA